MESQQEYEVLIKLYQFAITRLPIRFGITDDHVAALLDPGQKDLQLLDKYTDSKQKLMETKMHEYGVSLIQVIFTFFPNRHLKSTKCRLSAYRRERVRSI